MKNGFFVAQLCVKEQPKFFMNSMSFMKPYVIYETCHLWSHLSFMEPLVICKAMSHLLSHVALMKSGVIIKPGDIYKTMHHLCNHVSFMKQVTIIYGTMCHLQSHELFIKPCVINEIKCHLWNHMPMSFIKPYVTQLSRAQIEWENIWIATIITAADP